MYLYHSSRGTKVSASNDSVREFAYHLRQWPPPANPQTPRKHPRVITVHYSTCGTHWPCLWRACQWLHESDHDCLCTPNRDIAKTSAYQVRTIIPRPPNLPCSSDGHYQHHPPGVDPSTNATGAEANIRSHPTWTRCKHQPPTIYSSRFP